ncbi:3-hydroxyacyl-CoA dehydrogenase/enoyl-CoA hydratase family protein [Bacillus cytotoxicus]|uniref:3-hydroxyacyl-CoA dehydrogenase NAD-binding n=1 Tax=Bacillus cytotoxicus (strain DSM 22905 / CIP 110041 / 391-98 / NVH 391-98) TaxID=315749 RepID=A7GUI9_BACCN|nr:3-hydroxyacyl-CoA dehydrogenase/enoyl-CoA hydratase family protein [Bacillus cytotoxicus]ABS23797.1 3-hydroxyacyl-CoA dehydrogenase NAD-binding [Bacillus cytotoxicus NVH 391-98]MDH2865126.1 3-hydroxyacyl-CoA dehydrogenase/enoyl-CoA hydratase family protein [Bacillus cytotoxicus]MDH2880858.1 3-hydroxyacyl-CoA dehydrogenase/enoyl-CoA hydratase family protein [Bacillus cytotoxicus]MDH2884920.1 3-hydroxyacyl-CoA dehydrogenase/enoyl-CoA hydratase family protein [Bacillus cytotoxicus]NZD34868.1 e
MFQIKKAAVLGSGVMGSGIAAHLANIGIPTLLLDIVPRALTKEEEAKGLTLEHKSVRNRFSNGALQKLVKQKPAPLAVKDNLALITTGNLEDDLERLAEVDWIIEVVVENLDIKKQLFEKVDAVRKLGTIVSSNTSGISVEKMAEGRSDDFKKHFLGTHFFNPPRYLKLLEIIPTNDTDPQVLNFMKQFGEDVLGKGVVIAKDTPNFIGNRIGTYGLLVTLREMMERGYSVGEVDSVTGPLIGRPKSATFRTLDVVGLDTFVHVANNVYENVQEEERDVFKVPTFMHEMLDRKWLGSKTGQGFFLKKGKEILELNPKTMEYEERKKLKAASVELSKQEKGLANKLKALVYAKDRAGELLWNIITPTLLYSAKLYKEIADDIVAIDQAMKWGFGWEQGPFEIWDAIGVEKSVQKMEENGKVVPAWVKEMLQNGFATFYKHDSGESYYYDNGEYKRIERNKKAISLKQLKEKHGVIKKNSGASLIDLGDGILCLEFHSKSNAIGMDITQMINYAVDEVEKNYKGLVIGNQSKNFCVGANLAMILMEAQDDNYFEIEWVVKSFQDAMMKIKYCSKPVVAAPYGMTLGGGTEVCLPTASIQASSETYMGLVEVGVGLIPGGGGNKELYIKHLNKMAKGVEFDLQKVANKVFETIAMAKVSTSGQEAISHNFLGDKDGISVNGDHLLYDAKQKALALYEAGYKPPIRKKVPVVGETGYATLVLGAEAMHLSGYISEYDLHIAKKLAYVIAGGKVPYGTEVDEQYLLDIEREAFMSLISEMKSQARMQHMLVKGKPLRN